MPDRLTGDKNFLVMPPELLGQTAGPQLIVGFADEGSRIQARFGSTGFANEDVASGAIFDKSHVGQIAHELVETALDFRPADFCAPSFADVNQRRNNGGFPSSLLRRQEAQIRNHY